MQLFNTNLVIFLNFWMLIGTTYVCDLASDIGYPQTGEVSDSGTYACMNHQEKGKQLVFIRNAHPWP